MRAANCEVVVLRNEPQAQNIYLLTALWDAATPAPKAGQFYMLRAWAADEAPILSRPISLHSFDESLREVSFLYEVKGQGTEKLAALGTGDRLQLTGPAGNGFPIEGKKVALAGGGIGTAPLLQLAKELKNSGAEVHFFAGFRDEPYRLAAFASVCDNVQIATDTGRVGHHGFVTDLLEPEQFDVVYTCGPEIMMEKVARMCLAKGVRVYVSKEAKMACGLGACLGCTCKSKNGGVSVCKDGPVFEGSVFYG
ncbi:dihydroorotate dehydrogenase electron transfer subunit [uncultured Ruthenibacterium sp.]|uniref:dihydroorotate dehydrogenase electron transfer subunit n=1 Tax=uncultured Ruthenibacterium sp. TaxID=1905347 RepID=UPI00349EE025